MDPVVESEKVVCPAVESEKLVYLVDVSNVRDKYPFIPFIPRSAYIYPTIPCSFDPNRQIT